MISLVQIQLLEEKVEGAVARIMQLNQEKEALTKRCLQLEEENRLFRENLLSFEQDQERIEQGIIKALDRLNVVENSVLQAVEQHQTDGSQEAVEEVQSPTTEVAEQDVQAQQVFDNEMRQTNNPLPRQDGQPSNEPAYQEEVPIAHVPSENLGFAPMFSEEVVENDADYGEGEKPLQTDEFDFGFQKPQNDNLFAQNQDDQQSGQLDIF